MSVTKPLMLVLSGSNQASCLNSHNMGDQQLQTWGILDHLDMLDLTHLVPT